MSDTFGNAFPPVLFLLAALVSGEAVSRTSRRLTFTSRAGVLLTAFGGPIYCPKRRWLGMGVHSAAVLALYPAGIGGLVANNLGSGS